MKLLSMIPVAGFLACSLHADIIKPVGVTTNIDSDAGGSHLYLLDDNTEYTTEPNLADESLNPITLETGDALAKAASSFGALAGGAHAESWTRPTGLGNPEFVFDLGSDTAVGSLVLWQYGNNGGGFMRNGNHTRDFKVIFHTEAEGSSFDFATEIIGFADTMEAANGPGPGEASTLDNPAQLFFLGSQVTTRYVSLRIVNNYLGQPDFVAGGDRYGLGEVRFATETNPELPTVTLRVESSGNDLDFTWNSQTDKLYDLRSSINPEADGDPSTWTIVAGQEGITATPDTNMLTISRPNASKTLYALVEREPVPITLYSENFDDNDGSFVNVDKSGGLGTTWGHGDPDSTGPGGTVSTGNGGAGNCWGTNIGNPGYYLADSDACLRSPPINLSGVTTETTLSFALAMDILAPHSLVVNIINGTTEDVIAPAIATVTPDLVNNDASWANVATITLPEAALVDSIRIEWRFKSDANVGSADYLGAYIDDVIIETKN